MSEFTLTYSQRVEIKNILDASENDEIANKELNSKFAEFVATNLSFREIQRYDFSRAELIAFDDCNDVDDCELLVREYLATLSNYRAL